MSRNLHFRDAADWKDAESLLTFRPRRPRRTGGRPLPSLSIHVRDHRGRDLEPSARSLEAHYGDFVVTQARHGEVEARRRALGVSYGTAGGEARVAGHEGRAYELGPEPGPCDPDGRPPAVLVWHDGPMLYLVASAVLPVADLFDVAASMYDTA